MNRKTLAAMSVGIMIGSPVMAQSSQTAAPEPNKPAAPNPASNPPPAGQTVEVVGGRASDTDERRLSTAAKIVIGREEIDRYGDTTAGEVLRRLPGITTPGAPGRGGGPRMRGLGGGYTQILIDGQPIARGFSIESITPDQIERIEILRAPTAETGARAIAGTINIILREGFRRRLNDVRIWAGYEQDRFSPGFSWTYNNSADRLTYNLSASVFSPREHSESESRTQVSELATGRAVSDSIERSTSEDRRNGFHFTPRLQWRLSDTGDSLILTPNVFYMKSKSERQFDRQRLLGDPQLDPIGDYDFGHSLSETESNAMRLNLQWRQRLNSTNRLEMTAATSQWQSENNTIRREFLGARTQTAPQQTRLYENDSETTDRSATISLKLSSMLGGVNGKSEHSLVSGLEVESLRRNEARISRQDGVLLLSDFGENLEASSTRIAAYTQDEWSLNANWSFHAGVRWESISTKGEGEFGNTPTNDSSVVSPLAHLLWKPDPKKKDQVRLSLTRSYKPPALGTLIGRPSLNQRDPVPGPNTPTTADSAGNPDLKPELANGVDLAFERYLDNGGILSANLFYREIDDLMRRQVRLETVSWASVPRWVARQQNIGSATTRGIELEAKFRLDRLIAKAPAIDIRGNLSLYDSDVDGIPGPDNRLDQQAKATGNIGADYRVKGLPLMIGANLNWIPSYRTQLSDDQLVSVSKKTVIDAYALWTFKPTLALRVMASNLAPRDYITTNTVDALGLRNYETNTALNDITWRLRLELKL
jgi:outer membrane receptor for ferrienterochelin and colicins